MEKAIKTTTMENEPNFEDEMPRMGQRLRCIRVNDTLHESFRIVISHFKCTDRLCRSNSLSNKHFQISQKDHAEWIVHM
jgi:hypothetical protein